MTSSGCTLKAVEALILAARTDLLFVVEGLSQCGAVSVLELSSLLSCCCCCCCRDVDHMLVSSGGGFLQCAWCLDVQILFCCLIC